VATATPTLGTMYSLLMPLPLMATLQLSGNVKWFQPVTSVGVRPPLGSTSYWAAEALSTRMAIWLYADAAVETGLAT
jgi:hypothetical protein